jgi:hypothetical protein
MDLTITYIFKSFRHYEFWRDNFIPSTLLFVFAEKIYLGRAAAASIMLSNSSTDTFPSKSTSAATNDLTSWWSNKKNKKIIKKHAHIPFVNIKWFKPHSFSSACKMQALPGTQRE